VTVSVSTHVPKPHTPFQWCALNPLPEIRRKQALLRAELGREPRITLRVHDSPTSVLEGILARGDRRLGDVIERAFLNGASFDSWEERLRLDLWEEAFQFHAIDTTRYLGTIKIDARVPWDHFDIGLEQGFLAREYQKALKDRLSPPCGKVAGMFVHHTNVATASADQRRLVCYDCGVACDLTQMRQQRLGFLSDMGAIEKPQPKAAEPAHAQLVRLRLASKSPELHRPPQVHSRHERWRLRFEKIGPAVLLGHLDLVRELTRVTRRAGLRIHYTQGFHPKARLSFGTALSLGIASLDEYVDIDLLDPPDGHEIIAQLNRCCSTGLSFLDAVALPAGTPTLGASIVGARYVLVFPAGCFGSETQLTTLLHGFMQREAINIIRTTKGLGRKVDVRKHVLSLERGDAFALEAVRRAGIVGRLTTLVASVKLGPQGSTKPGEIVEALLGDATVPFQAIRERTLMSNTVAENALACAEASSY
jgi:radical SAM-linked protein